MADDPIIKTDLLGASIHFPPAFLANLNEAIQKMLFAALDKPALLIEVAGQPTQRYYYRSVDWHETLLLETTSIDGHWEAQSYRKNPGSEILATLLGTGKQLL
jgi:hypothetical protein